MEMASSWLEVWDEFEVHPSDPVPISRDRYLVPARQRAVAKGTGMELSADFFYAIELAAGRFRRVGLYSDRARAEQALAEG
jgi:hypothetical protein